PAAPLRPAPARPDGHGPPARAGPAPRLAATPRRREERGRSWPSGPRTGGPKTHHDPVPHKASIVPRHSSTPNPSKGLQADNTLSTQGESVMTVRSPLPYKGDADRLQSRSPQMPLQDPV